MTAVTEPATLSLADARVLDRYWRAANYLAVGQIYLMDNPLLAGPLLPEQIKPRLLGHWGTTPGLNFIWAHLSRAIKVHDVPMMIVVGPGHGGPAALACTWLEGSYTDVYPSVQRDAGGMRELFRQFSFPGGVPSHVSPQTPGSVHEGGELGYSLSHAHGAAFDNPDLVVACVVGDGEAETGPLATSWHSHRFINPVGDGAVLPILHLNGWKIANPAVLARLPGGELDALLRGYGYEPAYVTGEGHHAPHLEMAATLDAALARIRSIQHQARTGAHHRGQLEPGEPHGQRWPMIVLRTPKGWTGPAEVDGLPVEGTWRAHQVPLAEVRTNPAHLRQLEDWMRSYRPADLFGPDGRPGEDLVTLVPGRPAAARIDAACQRRCPAARPGAARIPRIRGTGDRGWRQRVRADPGPRRYAARRPCTQRRVPQLPHLRARRDRVQPAERRARGDRQDVGRSDSAGGREPRARRPGHGDPV